mgnify:FL=1
MKLFNMRLAPEPPPPCNPITNCELDWWPSDSEESFHRLMAEPTWCEYIESQGWHKPGAITYKLNSMGFRGEDPDWSKPTLMTFGCSLTMGIGLPQHQTWPWIIGQELGLQVVNFSMGGMPADWCFRMAEYWLPHQRPVLAIMLAPPHERLELIVDDSRSGHTYSSQETLREKFLQTWFAYDENVRLNNLKNKLAFLALCDQIEIPALCYDAYHWFARSREEIGFARDWMHGGPPGHRLLADQIINDWNEIKHT